MENVEGMQHEPSEAYGCVQRLPYSIQDAKRGYSDRSRGCSHFAHTACLKAGVCWSTTTRPLPQKEWYVLAGGGNACKGAGKEDSMTMRQCHGSFMKQQGRSSR